MSEEDGDAAADEEHGFTPAVDLMTQNRPREAEERLREVLRVQPNHAMAHSELDILKESAVEFTQAEPSILEAARESRTGRGEDSGAEGYQRLVQNLESSQEAEENYRLALQQDPSSVRPHVILGTFLKDLGRSAEAEYCFQNALSLDPSLADVHLNVALLQDARGGAEAEASFIAAILKGPRDSNAHRALGRYYFRQGKLLQAERSFRTSLTLAKSNLGQKDARILLAEVFFEKGNIQEALAIYTQAINEWVRAGQNPISFMMTVESGESGYEAALASERAAFNAACFSMTHLSKAVAAGLVAALDAMRALETSPFFVRSWFMESSDMYHSHQADKTYGAVWFTAWQVVARTSLFQAALGSSTEQHAGTATILVAGSGLGEQCLFAVALGARCVAYELLCDMVSRGKALMDQHGLSGWISAHCSNAIDIESFDHVQVVWLNDKFWAPVVRERLLERLAGELPLDALVVSFGKHFADEALTEVERVQISASWGGAETATLYRRTNKLSERAEL